MIRKFESGASRDMEDGKLDFDGSLSPLVLKGFAEYMKTNCIQKDGNYRPEENWKKGIPKESYIKSMWRHFHDLWMNYEGYESRDGLDHAMYGLLFNVMGFIHETEKEKLNETNE